MKSLFFGVYGDFEKENLEKNIHLFNIEGAREISEYHFRHYSLYCYNGETETVIHETSTYFLAITGFLNSEIYWDQYPSEPELMLDQLVQDLSGQFTIAAYCKETSQLKLMTDYFGLYSLFYHTGKGSFMFSNEYQPLLIQNDILLTVSITKVIPYFENGYAELGSTFFDEIQKCTARQQMTINMEKGISIAHYKEADLAAYKNRSYDEYLELVFAALKKAVANYTDKFDVPHFTLTGGLDSRFILALTEEGSRARSVYHSLYMEPLDETSDKDVLISKIIASRFGLNHVISSFEEKTAALDISYHEDLRKDNISMMTGVYGGELLSGILYKSVFHGDLLSSVRKKHPRKSFFGFRIRTSQTDEKAELGTLFSIMTSSFFTSIYGGSEGLWLCPWVDFQRYSTPFADTDFLKIWFSIPDTFLCQKHKNFYFDLYSKFIPSYKEIPTNSFLDQLEENGFLYFSDGVEAKKVKASKVQHLTDKLHLMEGYKLIPSRYKTNENLAVQNKRQRLIDFCVWYDYIQSMYAHEMVTKK